MKISIIKIGDRDVFKVESKMGIVLMLPYLLLILIACVPILIYVVVLLVLMIVLLPLAIPALLWEKFVVGD